MTWIKVKQLKENAIIPHYAKDGDAGFDLYTLEDTIIPAKTTVAIKTGIAMEIPEGYEVQIRPRSGNSLNGVVCYVPHLGVKTKEYARVILGTVDSGYRGELGIITENPNPYVIMVPAGTKLAQGVVNPIANAILQRVEELSNSERGEAGFGSTGGHKDDRN